MMRFVFLLILISIGGCFCDEDDHEESADECFSRENKLCDRSLLPTVPPENGEELLKDCRNIQALGRCLADAEETCDKDTGSKFKEIISYLHTACQEDNPTFQVISNNLECITRVVQKTELSCYRSIGDKSLALIEKHIDTFFESEQYDVVDCLVSVIEITCQGVQYAHHCGLEVKDAVEEVLRNFLFAPGVDQCKPEYLEEAEPFLEALEVMFVEELALENALKKRRK